MNIRSNSIVGKNGTDPTLFPLKATLPSGSRLTVQGNINISGITTVGFLTASNANITGVITASSFVGDGSNLTNIPSVTISKNIALRYIIADHPHRS